MKDNISLIGMPGAGKSTIGPLLARMLDYAFLDSDLLMEKQRQKTLQQILDQDGLDLLRMLEEKTILNIMVQRHVIATGGSVVYSHEAMEHLRRISTVVFLDLPLAEIKRRIGNCAERGLIRLPNQSIDHLFAERLPQYRRYATIDINCEGLDPNEIAHRIVELLSLSTVS